MTSKLLQNLPALCNMVRRIALEAGHVTLEYFDEAGYRGADVKGDGSPVTEADRAAEAVIEKALAEAIPGVPVVGEEAFAAGKVPGLSAASHFWLVDPVDGTKEFISGSGDYTVNIALIHDGAPVLGVVYAPAKGELYAGCGPGTAVRYLEDSDKEKPISVRPPPAKGLTVVASRNHGDGGKLDKFLSSYKVAQVIKRGSSLKICAVASGKADIYPRFGPTCEWDTAAGDAVLVAAGGRMVDFTDKPLRYGKAADGFLNPEFVALPLDMTLL
jgi:3'(2'), 5'-bisphosphate nucleotidase